MVLCLGRREGVSTCQKEESRSWLQDTSLLCFISKCLNQPLEVYAGFPGGKGEEKECTGGKGYTYEENERYLCILLFSCPLFPCSSLKKWPNISSSPLWSPWLEKTQQSLRSEGLREQRQWEPPENPAWVDDKRDLSSALRLGKFPVLPWHRVVTPRGVPGMTEVEFWSTLWKGRVQVKINSRIQRNVIHFAY